MKESESPEVQRVEQSHQTQPQQQQQQQQHFSQGNGHGNMQYQYSQQDMYNNNNSHQQNPNYYQHPGYQQQQQLPYNNNYGPMHQQPQYQQDVDETRQQETQRWLFDAVAVRSIPMLQKAIERGGNVNQPDDNDAVPLITSAKLKYDDMLQFLLNNGADYTICDKKGWTALHWAAVMGSLHAVQCLCQHGADVNVRTNGGKSAMDLAYLKNHLDVKDYLMSFAQEQAAANPMMDNRHRQGYQGSPPMNSMMPNGNGQAANTFVFEGRETPTRACSECGGTKTPQWRRGPDGSVSLCNACGLRFIKLKVKKKGGDEGGAENGNLASGTSASDLNGSA